MSDEINPNVETPTTTSVGEEVEKPVETPAITPVGEEEAGKPAEPVFKPESAEIVENKSELAPESQTAQISRVEPFVPASEPLTLTLQARMQELQVKEQSAIKNKKQKKLEKIMMMFDPSTTLRVGKKQITNDEVEKLLHVSDATATRYLSILKKEGRIQQNGKTGKGVSYSKV